MNNKYSLNKKDIISILIMIFCLLMIKLFPAGDYFQKLTVSLTFLLAVPALYVKIVLKKNFKNFGLRLGDWKQGVIWLFMSLAISFLVSYLIYNYASFAEKYYLPQGVIKNFRLFAFYEIIITGFFAALYEFFFRGFIMFSFSKKLKLNAIVLQFALFILFLAIAKDLNWTFAPYLISAPFAGAIAYKSRSLIYSYLFSLLFVIINDAVYIYSLIN